MTCEYDLEVTGDMELFEAFLTVMRCLLITVRLFLKVFNKVLF